MKEPADLSDAPLTSVVAAAAALSRRATSSRELVSTALTRARDPAGEGARVFTQLHAATARRDAEAWDARHAAGAPVTVLGGLPVSVKDLFDVAGWVTTAGSRVLADAPAATVDADAVTRLRNAGAIIVGKTNMTEFAYSGVGLNPHYGTPRNPFDRARSRIPGGSSSGAAVSVADGMCVAASAPTPVAPFGFQPRSAVWLGSSRRQTESRGVAFARCHRRWIRSAPSHARLSAARFSMP